jgi:hypothetical protein
MFCTCKASSLGWLQAPYLDCAHGPPTQLLQRAHTEVELFEGQEGGEVCGVQNQLGRKDTIVSTHDDSTGKIAA